MIIMTQPKTMKTETIVHQVNFSLRINAAKKQAISGVRLQTTATVDTEKYCIAVYEMKIDTVDWIVLNASAPFASGSTLSYMMCFRFLLRTSARITTDIKAFDAVIYKTSISGFKAYSPLVMYSIAVSLTV